MTKRADGTYVEWTRHLSEDPDFDPCDDKERAAIENGDMIVCGVQAMASIQVVVNNTATCYTIKSAGCWGVVVPNTSDSYLDEVYQEELATLKEHLGTFASMRDLAEVR